MSVLLWTHQRAAWSDWLFWIWTYRVAAKMIPWLLTKVGYLTHRTYNSNVLLFGFNIYMLTWHAVTNKYYNKEPCWTHNLFPVLDETKHNSSGYYVLRLCSSSQLYYESFFRADNSLTITFTSGDLSSSEDSWMQRRGFLLSVQAGRQI